MYSLERSQIEKLITQADQLSYDSDSVREGKRLLALEEEEFFQLEIERAEQLGVILCSLIHYRILVASLTVRSN